MFEVLIDYDSKHTLSQRMGDVVGCPVYRRRLSKGLPDWVDPGEVLSVERFHWNNNLHVYLTPIEGRSRGVGVTEDWAVDFIDPYGEITMTLRRDNFN